MELLLTLVSGIAWMIVYEECIRLGFRDRSYAMPFFALGLNFTWEAINCVGELAFQWHGATTGLTLVQTAVNGLWAALDVVILFTYFKFGKSEWTERGLKASWFVPWSVLGIACCLALQVVFVVEFGGVLAAQYSAFLQNLLMSVLFCGMYARRGGSTGQSVLLAVAKWIGTLAPTILMGIIEFNALVLVCGAFCTVFDLVYIWLLAKHRRTRTLPR